jgi:hypothetical protein
MKMSRLAVGRLLAIIVACCFVVSLTSDARAYEWSGYGKDESAGNARLFIFRESDFGTFIYLKLSIDGVPITILGRNVGYAALVRPGDHVISISTTPSPYGQTRHTDRRVMMKPGETYAFTALWQFSDRPILETSTEAQLSRQAFSPYRR